MVTDFKNVDIKVVSPVKLAHVVLRTNQLDKMADFYITFLGGTYAFQVPNLLAFLTYDDEHHRIGLIGMPDIKAKDKNTNGLEHIAFTFSTLSDLLLAYRQRKARGIEPVWSTNHGPTTSIYYKDPDGNILETQYDNFKTNEEANAFILENFKTNPIGVDFDPEDLIRRVEAGEPLESLVNRPDIGSRSVASIPI